MQKGILLSNHELLNDLYCFNLNAFCAIELSICSSAKEAMELVKQAPQSYSIIISLSNIEDEDAPLIFSNWAREKSIKIPMIIIGDMSKLSNTKRVYTLPPNLNIPLMVKSCAQILGVTAKDMASKVVPDFYPIPISMLRNFEKAPCDIFIKIGNPGRDEFSQVLSIDDDLSPNTKFESYVNDGVRNLYIDSSMRLKIVNAASQIVMEKLEDSSLSEQDRIATTEQGYEVIGGFLGESTEVTPEIVNISKKCMESITEILHSVPKVKNLLGMMLQNKTGHLYLHSVMGTYIARHIIKNISWGSDEHAQKLSFVFYFHDIYLAPIFAKYPHLKSEVNLVFHEGISERDKEIVVNHAQMASEMVKSFPRCPMGADAIILQHHGTSNGMGFAMEYKDDISPLAKVLIISEAFVDELVEIKDNAQKVNLEEIIEKLRVKFTKHTYKKIINCLEDIAF